MDKRKNNGGPRKGAGRPPKADEIKLIEKLTPLDPAAFEALEAGVKSGDFKFTQLYFNYMYGKPKESLDVTTDGESINLTPEEREARIQLLKAKLAK